MSRRVTVSIPDMLHEKLETWRNSFNLSKMFQEAVADAIQKKEDFQKRIKEDLNNVEIIERLKREKRNSEGNFAENGKIDGLAWAKMSHYDDLRYALEWNDFQNAPADKILGEYFLGIFDNDHQMDHSSETINEYATAYVNGWKIGIEEFWKAIKDKL